MQFDILIKNGFEIIDEAIVEDSKIYQVTVAEYSGVISDANILELRFGKINLLRRDSVLLDALERERKILAKRLAGKQKAGLMGGEDAELLAAIEKYIEN